MSGFFQPQTLEVDEKIFDQNLRIVESVGEPVPGLVHPPKAPEKSLLPEPDLPSVTVVPEDGMCVKTKNVNGGKVFINICKVHAIPPPKPITEEALQNIIANEDYESDYRIPMSLGAPHQEKDKSGNDCLACDVAVNSVWYEQTMMDSLTFTTFLVTLAMEGLCNKYGDVCNLDRQNWSILRNKRYMGKRQRHTIQQRASATKIEELSGLEDKETLMKPLSSSKPLITPVKEKPELILVKEPADASHPESMVATIQVPRVVSKNEMQLELGEDRLVLLSENYSLDVFLPFNFDPDQSRAEFDRLKRSLKIQMKVVQG